MSVGRPDQLSDEQLSLFDESIETGKKLLQNLAKQLPPDEYEQLHTDFDLLKKQSSLNKLMNFIDQLRIKEEEHAQLKENLDLIKKITKARALKNQIKSTMVKHQPCENKLETHTPSTPTPTLLSQEETEAKRIQLKEREEKVRVHSQASLLYLKFADLPIAPHSKKAYRKKAADYVKKLSSPDLIFAGTSEIIQKHEIVYAKKYAEFYNANVLHVAEKLVEAYDTAATFYESLANQPDKLFIEKYCYSHKEERCFAKKKQAMQIRETVRQHYDEDEKIAPEETKEEQEIYAEVYQKSRDCVAKLDLPLTFSSAQQLNAELSEIKALNYTLEKKREQHAIQHRKFLLGNHLFQLRLGLDAHKLPNITRTHIKNALNRIGRREINKDFFTIFLESYIQLPSKRNLSHFYQSNDNALKISLAKKLLEIVAENKTVSFKYSELGIMLNGRSSSLFKKLIDKYICVAELAGLKQAFTKHCVQDKKGFCRLDPTVSPDMEIMVNQTESHLRLDQVHFDKARGGLAHTLPV